MGHPEGSKNKYKVMQSQFAEIAKIISQLSNLFLVLDSDIRELKTELAEKNVIDKPEIRAEKLAEAEANAKKQEPTNAKTEDYFPKKEETDVDEVIASE